MFDTLGSLAMSEPESPNDAWGKYFERKMQRRSKKKSKRSEKKSKSKGPRREDSEDSNPFEIPDENMLSAKGRKTKTAEVIRNKISKRSTTKAAQKGHQDAGKSTEKTPTKVAKKRGKRIVRRVNELVDEPVFVNPVDSEDTWTDTEFYLSSSDDQNCSEAERDFLSSDKDKVNSSDK